MNKKQIFLGWLAVISLLLPGCASPKAVPPAQETQAVNTEIPTQCLSITLQTDEKSGGSSQHFTAEETGSNFTQGMSYRGVSNVEITLDGSTVALETALQQGHVTKNELLAMARRDVLAGNCQETYESTHGVAGYTFQYPNYSILIMDDIFEMPDAALLPISYMAIYVHQFPNSSTTYHISPNTSFTDPETGYRLDREDWGLSIELLSAGPTGLTLRCTQSGGVQIGALSAAWYHLSNEEGFLETQNGEAATLHMPISMNDASNIVIDWETTQGALPSGTYTLTLIIEDQFSEDQVHPLMDDFYDTQEYNINFVIP